MYISMFSIFRNSKNSDYLRMVWLSSDFLCCSSSKHAVVGLMDCLRLELKEQGKDGVKTSCICPAFVDTGFVKNPRTKFGQVLSLLTPEYVVDVAMKGVLTDQHLILVPPISSVMVMLK